MKIKKVVIEIEGDVEEVLKVLYEMLSKNVIHCFKVYYPYTVNEVGKSESEVL